MAQIMLDLPQDVRERVEARSLAANQKPEIFLLRVIEEYLEAQEDEEDAREADRVMKEIDAGRMETYPWEEVKARLGLED